MAPYGYFRVIRFLSDELGVSPERVQKWRRTFVARLCELAVSCM